MAPMFSKGLFSFLQSDWHFKLFPITFCDKSISLVLVFLIIYTFVFLLILDSQKPSGKDESHGSAKWGSPECLKRKYKDKNGENIILTQHVEMGVDGQKHKRNLNVLVCGGSGSGKTRFYVKPNVLNCNTSFCITDPKGEVLRTCGLTLKKQGYRVKVLDLINMDKSHCYNPFVYLRDDNDIQRLVTNIMANTVPKGSKPSDPFWDQAASMLLLALVFYLHYEAPPEEQNFPMVIEMIRAGEVKEDNDSYQSVLDILFNRLQNRSPEHIALKYYRSYRSGSSKTLKSIQITLISRLEKFNLESLAGITQYDELELDKMGEEKTALFAVIPDNDDSFNFLVGLLYTQLFQGLYYQADFVYGGRLPIHVHFLMDEFANIGLPDQFDKLLATMRSREISVSIILQNMAQLKALFEKNWESIVGNCDTFLYLGGNELSTHEYLSKMLGRETITYKNRSSTKGRNGSHSVSDQTTGRSLMMEEEVRTLDNRKALLLIRGEPPICDDKYDVSHHPHIADTPDGGGPVYAYGEDTWSSGLITTLEEIPKEESTEEKPSSVECLSEEEVYEKIKKEMEKRYIEEQTIKNA